MKLGLESHCGAVEELRGGKEGFEERGKTGNKEGVGGFGRASSPRPPSSALLSPSSSALGSMSGFVASPEMATAG